MTTYVEAWDELVSVLEAADLHPTQDTKNGAAPPCTIVNVAGIPELSSRRQSPGAFRLLLVAGAWSGADEVRTLAGMIDAFAVAFAPLAGWGVGPIEPPTRIKLGNGEVLAASVTVSRQIDYTED